MILFIVALVIYFAVGAFGFAQIIGSIQNAGWRGPGMTAFTIILWTIILAGVAYLVLHFLTSSLVPLLIGYIATLVMVLGSGRVQ